MKQIPAGLTIGIGLNKGQNSWTGLYHWQIQTELSQFSGNPEPNEHVGTGYTFQSLVNPTRTWINKHQWNE